MTGRVYLPVTRAGLAGLADTGALGPAPLEAYAATPALRAWYSAGAEAQSEGEGEVDDEELEAVAAALAAQASLALLSGHEQARLVVAADVRHGADETDQPGRVRVDAEVPAAAVAAVLADTAEAAPAVRAAVADPTEATLDAVERHDLAWFAPDEVPVLLAGLGGTATG